MRKLDGPQILTANALFSGAAVYWTGADWSPRIADAAVLTDDTSRGISLKLAEANEGVVVGPYFIGVEHANRDEPEPVRLRETMRVTGPSVRGDLGPQTA